MPDRVAAIHESGHHRPWGPRLFATGLITAAVVLWIVIWQVRLGIAVARGLDDRLERIEANQEARAAQQARIAVDVEAIRKVVVGERAK